MLSYPVSMTGDSLLIEPCPAVDRADALRLLHDGLSADQQAALPAALEEIQDQGEDALSGLFVARLNAELIGVVWVQLAPGNNAVLWPPAISNPAANELMRAAEEFIRQRSIPMAQMIIHPDAPQAPEVLSQGGFEQLVDLEYLALESSHFPTPVTDDVLSFMPFSQVDRTRFIDVMMQTYNDTLDCPQINGLRTPDEILASYEAQGEFSPERWFLIQHDQQDVGVLILTEYPVSKNWELIYMGIIPPARGQQLGQRIVRFALAQAARAGASRLVLAADAANSPALDMYRAAGLIAWDRRRVYARLGARDR